VTLAHVEWFEPGSYETRWDFATEGTTLLMLAAAVVVTIVLRLFAQRVWSGVDLPFFARMAPWMPFALRIHLAVSLISLLSLGFYLSPAMDLHPSVTGVVLGAVMVVVAIGMATGWHTREAAILLIAAGPLGMLEFGVWEVVKRVDMLGPALFVLLAGPGRWSADWELGRAREASREAIRVAVWALKVAVGVALIFVAFAEKLIDPERAVGFLADRPEFNVFREVGIPMGDLEYVRLAGCIEVLFGLLIISGALPQIGVVIIGIPINATLFFYGETELAGHLPIYGTMLVLLVYGSDPELRRDVMSLWPFRSRAAGRAGPRTAASSA
jgi:hypothetical protein